MHPRRCVPTRQTLPAPSSRAVYAHSSAMRYLTSRLQWPASRVSDVSQTRLQTLPWVSQQLKPEPAARSALACRSFLVPIVNEHRHVLVHILEVLSSGSRADCPPHVRPPASARSLVVVITYWRTCRHDCGTTLRTSDTTRNERGLCSDVR